MSRIRTVKPELFRHEELYEAEKETKYPLRLVFIALFTVCDREGRFKWKPNQLKLDCLPYDNIDFSRVLDALMTRGFICKYEVSNEKYGYIPSFLKHQVINNRESDSKLPEPEESNIIQVDNHLIDNLIHASSTRHGLAQGEGKRKGREKEGEEEGNTLCTEPKNGSNAEMIIEKQFILLPLNIKNTFHVVTENDILKFKSIYPAVNVEQEIRSIFGWLDTNPEKRKTKAGILRFINAWLCKSQDNPKRKEQSKHSFQSIDYGTTGDL